MANTIRLKRGSGSDPSASDLVVGELAIRTDSGKIFTKKDNGSVAEISGGGGIDDGDKGDITISNGGDTFTIDNGVVTSAKIANGTIVDADISGSAAIAGSKLQAAGLVNAGSMSAANFNKLAGIEANATADMTGSEILSTISGENIILGEISSTGNSSFAGNVTISSSDGGSAAAPELDLYRISASPADADYLGQIKFSGESDDGSKEIYAKITGKIGDASSGTEDGIIEIAHRKAGSNNISARFTSEDLKLINGTGLEVAGDLTASSDIKIDNINKSLQVGNITGDNYADLRQISASSYKGFTLQHDNASVLANLQGSTNQYLVLGDNDNGNGGTIFGIAQSQGGTDYNYLTLSAAGNLNISNNITLGGTVDGVDIATRDTLFGGLTSSSGVLSNGVTATTQAQSDNSTKVSTTAYVRTAISNLVNSAPSTLDTLKELSDALGADANFSTTVTNSIATKMPLAGGTFSGNIIARFITPDNDSQRDLGTTSVRWRAAYVDNYYGSGANLTNLPSQTDQNFTNADHSKLDGIEANATADQTASEILTLLKTVDGAGSGLDADTLDGISSASFLRSDAADTMTGLLTMQVSADRQIQLNRNISSPSNYYAGLQLEIKASTGTAGLSLHRDGNSHVGIYTDTINKLEFDFNSGDVVLNHDAGTIWGSGNDGSGSGLDADLLDGVQGSNYLRSDTSDTISGNLTVTGNVFIGDLIRIGDDVLLEDYNAANAFRVKGNQDGNKGFIAFGSQTKKLGCDGASAALTYDGHEVVTQNSNLNASNIGSGTIPAARVPTLNQNTTGSAATLTTARTIAGVSFDGSANISLNNNAITNGAGYITSADGGNAATLDSLDSTQFLRSDADDSFSGTITANSDASNPVIKIQGAGPNFIQFATDSGGTVDADSINLIYRTSPNTLAFERASDATILFSVDADNGQANIPFNLDVGSGLDVTGNISCSGTVDGRDVASDGTKLDGIESGATADQTVTEIKSLIAGSPLGATHIANDAITSDELASNSVNSAHIINGSITNTDINASAAIAGSKISPTFTSAVTIDVNGTDNGSTTLLTLDNFISDIGTEYSFIDFTFRDTNANATPQVKIGAQAGDPTGNQTQEGTADFVVQCGVDNNSSTNTMTEMFRCSHDTKITSVHHHPQSDSNFDLGTSSTRWRNIYGDTLYGNGANITAINASNISSGTIPDARFPSTLPAIDGSNLTGISAGATGGGSDEVFYENDQTVTTNYTITNGKNAMAAGPIEIQNGVTVTVGSGETLTIV